MKKYILIFIAFSISQLVFSQTIEKIISDSLTAIARKHAQVGRIQVLSIRKIDSTLIITASDGLSQLPLREENVTQIYDMLARVTAKHYPSIQIVCISDQSKIEDLIPVFYRTGKFESPHRAFDSGNTHEAFLVNLSRPFQVTNGLQNKHLAVWQSHGLYYNQTEKKWLWQRAKLFHTVEDLFTQSYVLPFLVPMLENAGANVFLPRERCTQRTEIIIDNDSENSQHRYREYVDIRNWKTGYPGFANFKNEYLQGENPFQSGTYRIAKSVKQLDEASTIEWIPAIPAKGKYAVYVSYTSFKNSAPDARYTVVHAGGKTDFKLDQRKSGGTWIYLGSFLFDAGRNSDGKVVLSNYSSHQATVVSADAVKIGGGMGNIARNPNMEGVEPNKTSSDTTRTQQIEKPQTCTKPITSNYPRYTEGARYWLQWAGMPDSVYSVSKGKNDYTDDFQSRGAWVNYLAGGSPVLPNHQGLGIPLDLALSFHSDAGTTLGDSIIGILGICTVTKNGSQVFANGDSRWTSRDLTDLIQTQITDDVRKLFAPEFTRRGLWNRNYSESRVPEVPTMLLELLSHQNFADMRYGLDPRFKFAVSRAIYKGMLQFLHPVNYVVQPLPVTNFHLGFVSKNKLQLNWEPTPDPLEPTANAKKYIVYTRIDEGDFDNGQVVTDNQFQITLRIGKIYSFKVTALNDGGESFPSEILSACKTASNKKEVLIVNGFNRLSAPGSFDHGPTKAGFLFDYDAGVPYINDYSFIGKQFEFDRSKPWLSDENPGFGHSYTNYEDQVIAGNTFDYPFLHGRAIKSAGYSFVSSDLSSVLSKKVNIQSYQTLNLILGKQRTTHIGNRKKEPEFKTLPLELQQQLRTYTENGGNIMLSGAFVASDAYPDNSISVEDKRFQASVLKIKLNTTTATFSGKVTMTPSQYSAFGSSEFDFYTQPNATSIFVESVDAIEPVGAHAFTICRYKGTNQSAGVAYRGKYKSVVFGFPFETIRSERERNKLMQSVLQFFESKDKRVSLQPQYPEK